MALWIGTLFSFLPSIGLLAFMAGAFVLMGWIVNAALRLVRSVRLGQWRRAASFGLALAAVWPLAPVSFQAGEVIHLALRYPAYAAMIASDPERSTKPILFRWGEIDGSARILVYDAAGANGAEVGPEVIANYRRDLNSGATGIVQHLVGSFYLITLGNL